MSKFVIEGKFWYAGDNIYIETEEKGMNGLPTEVCLNEFIKDNIAEESEITIVIEPKKSMDKVILSGGYIMFQTKRDIYEEMTALLTHYEHPEDYEDYDDMEWEALMYEMLVKIQNRWEDTITANEQ